MILKQTFLLYVTIVIKVKQFKRQYPTGDKHTISTLLIKPIFSVLAYAEKQFFSKLVFECLKGNNRLLLRREEGGTLIFFF